MPDWVAQANDTWPEEDQGTPLPAGTKYVGYVSDVILGAPAGDADLAADFGLPAGTADDQPYAGPFNHVTLAGMRVAIPDDLAIIRAARGSAASSAPSDFDPSRPVECDIDAIEETLTFCPATGGADLTMKEILAGTDLATRDLRVAAGGPVTVEQGQTASVPFTLRAAGPAADQILALAPETSIPGATATTAHPVWQFPGAGDYAEAVSVQVPLSTPPGEYTVRLVATAGDEAREAVAKLIVTAKTVPPLVETPERRRCRPPTTSTTARAA